MQPPTGPTTMACPSCGASIEFDRRFSPWCEACDWNLFPAGERRPTPGPLERRRLAVASRLAASASMAPDQVRRPPDWSVPSVVVWLVAIGTFLVWALLVVGGIWFVVGGHGWILFLFGLLLLGLAFASRPRLGKAPEHVLGRDEAPALHGLVERVARELDAPRVHALAVDGEWNASTYRYGLRRRTAVQLGLPLWRALDDEARLALLTHEVAHGVNGDTTRGGVQSAALQTLVAWIILTEPDGLTSGDPGLLGLAAIPGNLFLGAVSTSLTAVVYGMLLLSVRPSRQAELYADRLGARVAGRPAMVRTLERLTLEPAFARTVSGVAIRGAAPAELFARLQSALDETPASEIRRLQRREAVDPHLSDATHPPVVQRIAALHGLGDATPTLVVDPAEMRAIDAELTKLEPAVAKDLVEAYLDAIS